MTSPRSTYVLPWGVLPWGVLPWGDFYPGAVGAILDPGWAGLPAARVRYVGCMATITRVLDPEPVRSFEAYRDSGGGRGLDAARKLGPAATIEEVEASGLRGRGGAGFPTGRKWATVATNDSAKIGRAHV